MIIALVPTTVGVLLKIEIRRSSFDMFSVLVPVTMVRNGEAVPIVLTHNFRTKSDFQLLTPEAKKITETLVIDEMVWVSSIRLGEKHFNPQYSNAAFSNGNGKFMVIALLNCLKSVFKQPLEVTVLTDHLPVEVVASFQHEAVDSLSKVRITFDSRRT